MKSPRIVKIYGIIWLGISLAAFGYLIYLNHQFASCCSAGDGDDMAIGFMNVFIGLLATLTTGFAVTLLLAKTKAIQRLSVVMLSLLPSICFIARPLIGLGLLVTMAFVLYSTSTQSHLK